MVNRVPESLRAETLCPKGKSMFKHRTKGEVGYLDTFRGIPVGLLWAWWGAACVHPAARLWDRAQLRDEFRFLRKNGLYRNVFFRIKRRLRSKHEIPYQLLATFGPGSELFRRVFPSFTAFWNSLEMPRSWTAELPPVFSYGIRKLMDPKSPWLVWAYTELAAKTAAFILFEVYESCRVWALSRNMIQGIRRLDLKTILGNAGNANECLSLIDTIESSRFRDLPEEWTFRGMLPSLAPGRTDRGAYYRYFNPFTSLFIT